MLITLIYVYVQILERIIIVHVFLHIYINAADCINYIDKSVKVHLNVKINRCSETARKQSREITNCKL